MMLFLAIYRVPPSSPQERAYIQLFWLGTIDIGEFVQMMFPNAAQLISNLKKNFADESEVRAAFNSWDTNKDGQISFAELKSAVQRSGQRLTDDDINAIFVVGDKDQNGTFIIIYIYSFILIFS